MCVCVCMYVCVCVCVCVYMNHITFHCYFFFSQRKSKKKKINKNSILSVICSLNKIIMLLITLMSNRDDTKGNVSCTLHDHYAGQRKVTTIIYLLAA